MLTVSGEDTGDVAAEIIQAGVTDYLRNPLEPTSNVAHPPSRTRRRFGREHRDGQRSKLSGVGVIGTDERFERVGETYASYYGYESEELVGKHWSELHPSNEVQHIRTHVIPAVRSGGKRTRPRFGHEATKSRSTMPIRETRFKRRC